MGKAIPVPVGIRLAERCRWSADLLDAATAGLVLHGAAGAGKSTLAAQIAERAGRFDPERVIRIVRGEVSADALLDELGAGGTGLRGLSWEPRLALLRVDLLGRVPVLVVLDDFDDNLIAEPGGWVIGDPALAGLVASWAGDPRLSRLLITCRHPFNLPGGAEGSFGLRYVGPLSRLEATELAASLPSLSALEARVLDRAWRLTGGHPGVLGYLDTVLTRSRFEDVAARLGPEPEPPTGLSPAEAEAVAAAAGDLLLDELRGRLSAPAQALLTGASVYRVPVGCTVSLLPAGRYRPAAELDSLAAEGAAAGLLRVDAEGQVLVPRWTATDLHRRLVAAHRGDELTGAHHRAAQHWRGQAANRPQDRRARAEARYHRLQVGHRTLQDQPPASYAAPGGRSPRSTAGRRARLLGLAAGAAAAVALVAAGASGLFSARSAAPSAGGTSGGVAAQTAAWVASQVSRGAIVACDPVMCSALQAHGIAAGNLLTVRPGAPGPRSADVVVATPAVRSQFGGHLASVYAPAVLASFGSGQTRVDVRAVAPTGAAAYLAGLALDQAARQQAGAQLVANPRITVPAAARVQLSTGLVDARLMMILAAMAAAQPVRVVTFSDAGPGASPRLPLRAARLTVAGRTNAAAGLPAMLAFARAQRPPYLPAQAVIQGGVLSIEFAAPSPAGLLPAAHITS